MIDITGTHLKAVTKDDIVLCRFNGVDVTAIVEGSTSIFCQTPDLQLENATAVVVEISTNSGAHFTPSESYLYNDVPDVLSVSPLQGTELGGATVTLLGTGFFNTPQLGCKFHNTFVPATYVSSSMITCVAPAREPITGECLDVTLNGHDFTDCVALYTHTAAATLNSLAPSSGPLGGNTEVIITGANFASVILPDVAPMCRFGDMWSIATVLSNTTIVCAAAPLATTGIVPVSLFAGAEASLSSLTFEYTVPFVLRELEPVTLELRKHGACRRRKRFC